MRDRNQQDQNLIKSMVHGKPSRHRQQSSEPCIYDIFNWKQPTPSDSKSKRQNNSKDHYEKLLKSCVVEPQNNFHYCCRPYKQNQQVQPYIGCEKCQQGYKSGLEEDTAKVNQQYMIDQPKKHLKPHAVKHELYMYDNVHLKKAQPSQSDQNNIQPKKKDQIIKNTKLNEHDQLQRKVIDKRKQKIKQFKQFTRDLPNSAFTTYYGRPAFQSYGRCNSSSQMRTHNVMPHRGENHPKAKQTYEGALIKGKKVKIQDHLPRKPIESKINEENKGGKKQKLIHLPLQKPDLVNHVRFAEPKATSDRKDPVPSYQKLKNEFKKRQKQELKKRNKKKPKTQTDEDDHLAYMNTRDHLIDIIENKKLKESKLAYKVTECYPDLDEGTMRNKNEIGIGKPAGMEVRKSEPAQNIIYRKY